MGLLSAVLLLVIPVWMAYDFFLGKSSFSKIYSTIELQLKQKNILVAVIIIGSLNWLWNIYKNV